MKTTTSRKATPIVARRAIVDRRWIAALMSILLLAFLISTDGFQTFRSKERRLVVAADEIVTARKVYRDVSPGTAKDFPSELTDLLYDPPMLACGWPRAIGVHCLSNERPKFSATLLLI